MLCARRIECKTVAWLLPLVLTGCLHTARRQPVQSLAPPVDALPKPTPTPDELPPSAVTIPSEPLKTNTPTQASQKPRPPIRRKKAVSDSPQQAANSTAGPSENTPQAANESPGVSAIGQLSSGDPSDLRQQTVDSVAAIERGLNGIGRTLGDQDQKTAAQIREFLKQAREALATGDVDGARTLAAKAKVLLSEISR